MSSTKRRIEDLDQDGGRHADDMFSEAPNTNAQVKDHSEAEGSDDLDLDTLKARKRGGLCFEDEYSSASDTEGSPTLRGLGVDDKGRDYENEDEEGLVLERSDIGVPIEPFNLRQELEMGTFDKETGSYVPRKDINIVDDVWLTGLTDNDMKRAQLAQARRNAQLEAAQEQPVQKSPRELVEELAMLLELGETPTESIQRRALTGTTRRFDAKSRKLAASRTPEQKAAEDVKRGEIEKITELCSSLMDAGIIDVYEMTKEELQRKRTMFR